MSVTRRTTILISAMGVLLAATPAYLKNSASELLNRNTPPVAVSDVQPRDSSGRQLHPANSIFKLTSPEGVRRPETLVVQDAPVTWNWTHNVATTENPSSVVKNSGNDSYNDAYAYSNEALTADGDYFQWTMGSNVLECSLAITSVYSDNYP
jgi:hypothetical protein